MTITRAFGFTLDTQTGAVERWAAGDPASVAGRRAIRPAEPQEHWCELCGDSLTTLQHDAAIGWYRNCDQCGSEYQGAAERGKAELAALDTRYTLRLPASVKAKAQRIGAAAVIAAIEAVQE